MSSAPRTFIVETQERALAASLRAEGANVEVARLTPIPSADVITHIGPYLIGVERKAASDLLGSWITPQGPKGCTHLASQLSRMIDVFDLTILFGEGWFGKTEQGYIATAHRAHKLLWDGLWNTLARWQSTGVMIQFSADTPHTAHRLVSLTNYIEGRLNGR